mmetsp:Transcript_11632/g.37220  ORF Transcript_11632/g.37220 Transcript_11632/m.37220 type:complete len:244 (+) Transcript_11632:768-1499(+)
MAPRPAASASCAHWRKRWSDSAGKEPAMAVTISWTNWKTFRDEYWSLASPAASTFRIFRERSSARNTRGTSVCLMRCSPPCPKCFRAQPRTLKVASVSSLTIKCARRLTRICSRSPSAAGGGGGSSGPGGFSASPPSRRRGAIMAKRRSTASTESRGSPAAKTHLTRLRLTSLRRFQGRYATSVPKRPSSSTPVRPMAGPSGRLRHRSSSSASPSSSGAGASPSAAGRLAWSTAAQVPKQWFT